MRKFTLIVLLSFLSACSDPIVGIPGGKLKGKVQTPPETWSHVPDVVQLETRPSDPYSINIWAVVSEGNIYVATREAKWVPFIAEDPAVRVRIDRKLYNLSANPVTDVEERLRVAQAYQRKYDYETDDVDAAQTRLYRLAPRMP